MVFGVGVDLFRISRISNLAENLEDPFFVNAFTPKEREQAQTRTEPIIYFATRFAGKEAVYKAISKCGCDFRPKDIEIIDLEDGQPTANLLGKTKECLKQHYTGNLILHVSISYETDYAEAFVMIETLREVD